MVLRALVGLVWVEESQVTVTGHHQERYVTLSHTSVVEPVVLVALGAHTLEGLLVLLAGVGTGAKHAGRLEATRLVRVVSAVIAAVTAQFTADAVSPRAVEVSRSA